MSSASGNAPRRARRVLGELDPNWDLNTPRGRTKRLPIVWETENENAVLAGLTAGTYYHDEVEEYTNYSLPHPAAAEDDTSDGEEAIPQTLLPAPPLAADANEDEEEEEEDDDDDDDDEDDEDLEAELAAEFGAHDDELLADDMDEDMDEQDRDEQADEDEHFQGPVFNPTAIGLKEINNLAHFGVSSHKPGNGVEQLLNDDLDQYWQSDGQQPHLLTIHFLRRVEIRALRFYVDYSQDESYTPTHIVFYAGTGPHDLIQFAEVPLTNPIGWQDVPISDCGGSADGHSLCCWIVQMHIKENHQNGKDTHIRGIKIFGLDENNANFTSEALVDTEDNMENLDSFPGSSPSDQIIDPAIRELMEAMESTHSRFGRDEGRGSPDFMNDPIIR